MGKGSARRPMVIDPDQFQANWSNTFGSKEQESLDKEPKSSILPSLPSSTLGHNG